ncbi:putative sulfatase [Marinimicrobium koreense]|uniref:Putative sulfatase n=1 Tax=Marinimicrobium koreense TaxID=306545 RepID=A0A3N1NZX7_9GAMM|nr:sulfatase [Marinimicrobium koreense]ROQ21703.1 putative sulfatase [Marinimicrobium koreense]
MKTIALLSLVFLCFHAKAQESPNILLFIADDLGYLDTEIANSPDAKTPNIKQLASEGMVFERAYVNSPTCAPSRAALFTGLRSQRNGIEANHDKTRLEGVKHILTGFQDLGYEIAAFGKIRHGKKGQDPWDHGVEHYGADSIDIQEIATFLKKRDPNRPLLLLVGSNPPHVPWPRKSSFDPKDVTLPIKSIDTPKTRISWSQYLEDVRTMDELFGQTKTLFEQYSGKNSIVAFTSDHGAQWPFAKWNLYEAGTRVPLVLKWPEKVPAGSDTQALVSWIDIFPTLTELAGGTLKVDIDGTSFANVLRHGKKDHREKVFTTHTGDGVGPNAANSYPMRAVVQERFKYIRNMHPEFLYTNHLTKNVHMDHNKHWPEWEKRAKHDPHSAAIVGAYLARPAEELYDLKLDPHEQNNLAQDPDHVDALLTLRNELNQFMHESRDRVIVTGQPIRLIDCWLIGCPLQNSEPSSREFNEN